MKYYNKEDLREMFESAKAAWSMGVSTEETEKRFFELLDHAKEAAGRIGGKYSISRDFVDIATIVYRCGKGVDELAGILEILGYKANDPDGQETPANW